MQRNDSKAVEINVVRIIVLDMPTLINEICPYE